MNNTFVGCRCCGCVGLNNCSHTNKEHWYCWIWTSKTKRGFKMKEEEIRCCKCGCTNVDKEGHKIEYNQETGLYRCKDCGRLFEGMCVKL